jgi:hypothetical protein
MYFIIKMSKGLIIGGVIFLMLIVIGVVVYFTMMGGDGEETPSTNGSTTPSGLPKGRYVKIEQTVVSKPTDTGDFCSKNAIINLAEVEVFDKDGTNLASGKTVTGTAILPDYPLANLVDDDKTNFAHTACPDPINTDKDNMLIDLGSVKEIKKIVITNRTDCCKERAIGIKAVVLGADGTTVIKETPAVTTEADTYTFTFPGTSWS